MVVSVFITNNPFSADGPEPYQCNPLDAPHRITISSSVLLSDADKGIIMARLSSRCELSVQLREERPFLRKVGGKVHQRAVHQHRWMEEVLKRRLL